MEKVEEREKLSDKTLKLLKDLEEKLLKQFTHITTSLQADSFFKKCPCRRSGTQCRFRDGRNSDDTAADTQGSGRSAGGDFG